MLSFGSTAKIEKDEYAERFPVVDHQFRPFGNRVFVQIRYPVVETKGGISLNKETVEHAYHNEQVGLVVAMGGGCFKFATSGEDWPEFMERFNVGDCVRVPLHGGDNQWRVDPISKRFILLKVFKDHEIMGAFANPLDIPTNYAYF